MTTIVIGTTPTIIYSFSTVAPSDFVKAEFTIMGHNTVLLTKQMSDATIKENQIMWKLTQKEATTALNNATARIDSAVTKMETLSFDINKSGELEYTYEEGGEQ